MNLAERIIVNGLNAVDQPEFSGKAYLFVAYTPDGVVRLNEAESVFDVLFNAFEQGFAYEGEIYHYHLLFTEEGSDNPDDWPGIEQLPDAVRQTNNLNLIAFLLDMHQWFDFLTRDDAFHEDGYMADILKELPDATFVFGWSVAAHRQDEAYAVLEMHE